MIIKSLMDTDQYIFTMCQAFMLKYPNTMATFKFKCRNKKLKFSIEQMTILYRAVDELCSLRFRTKELIYLSNLRYFQPFFIEHLRTFQLNREYANCFISNGELQITISGPLSSIIWFEVPLLRIISYINSYSHGEFPWIEGKVRLKKNIEYVKKHIHRDQLGEFKLTDFGTRRAYSPSWHEEVIKILVRDASEFFVGTSNMMFAMKYGLTPIGTMAHLWIQAHQQLGYSLVDSQRAAFQAWADVYRGDLGIALSDTVGMKAFLKDFDLYFSKLFDGARHDSGDPYKWARDLWNHYHYLGINSETKTAIFSDGLTFQLAVDLFKEFNSVFGSIGFGIGTNLTNDLGVDPLQIVIKMTACSPSPYEPLRPVAKISDSKGKGMCEDPEYLAYLKKVYNIKEERNVHI